MHVLVRGLPESDEGEDAGVVVIAGGGEEAVAVEAPVGHFLEGNGRMRCG